MTLEIGTCRYMQLVQDLLVQRDPTEVPRTDIHSQQKKASSCEKPLCAACQLGKNHRRTPHDPKTSKNPIDKVHKLINLKPGECVSMDQYISSKPGRLPHTFGKEGTEKSYHGGTIFVDHASGFVFVKHQILLNAPETVRAKRSFERYCASKEVKVQKYWADNAPFGSAAFCNAITEEGQTISFSGVGAHHQNAVAKRSIGTIMRWAKTILLHSFIHWPEQSDTKLWAFALDQAVWIWNNLPRRGIMLSPYEIFTGDMYENYEHLRQARVWGCPAYVLDPKLQDAKKIPKWDPHTQREQYLCVSPEHSTTVGWVLNLKTGSVSPQYHVVYDDWFATVPNFGFKEQEFMEVWDDLFQNGYKDNVDEGTPLRDIPELSEEWLNDVKK